MDSFLALVRSFWLGLQNGQLPELGAWSYLILSLLIVAQGPLATLFGGAAASAGLLKPELVLLAGAVGNLTADIIWYRVGKAGKIEWLLRRVRWLGIKQEHIKKAEQGMRQHAIKILLMAKLSAGLAVPALIAAGLARVKWRRWFPVVMVGETIWTGALTMLGYYFFESIKQIEEGLQLLMLGTAAAFILILIFTLIPKAVRARMS